jgi:hypothetical protein
VSQMRTGPGYHAGRVPPLRTPSTRSGCRPIDTWHILAAAVRPRFSTRGCGTERAKPSGMLKVLTASACLVVAATLFACSGGTGTVGGGSTSSPVDNGQLTSNSGLTVDATISAATLGDECGDSSSKAAPAQGDVAGTCAANESGFAPSGCGGCQASNVQISFTSGDGSIPAKIEILGVTLHDANDGSEVDQLEASSPQKWDSSGGYSAWDQTIAPKTELKASYTLSSPAWSTMSDTSYARKFRLRVTVKMDGAAVVLQSAILSREPAVAT